MGFLPNFWSRVLTLSGAHTHPYITERAIVNVTLETRRGPRNTGETMQRNRPNWAVASGELGEVVKSNAAMDFLSSTRSNPVYHFDSDHVDSAMGMLRQLWTQTLLSVRAKEYQRCSSQLGPAISLPAGLL
ncbi:hypothetical protein FQN60_004676 [Etheostoma spectabile]|uniref:VWA7 N-terminal domain-containing protein n=1 Tax=Etheostoma spectabile TaxID=54343 RepID=A0A5J5DKJ8_9PERO|nr:hypothetical protein FQN60_004676 [Etheostoma spectabile]